MTPIAAQAATFQPVLHEGVNMRRYSKSTEILVLQVLQSDRTKSIHVIWEVSLELRLEVESSKILQELHVCTLMDEHPRYDGRLRTLQVLDRQLL